MIVGIARKKKNIRELPYRIAKNTEVVKTLGGTMPATAGDYIIVGVTPYVYSPKVFEELFDIVEESTEKDEV